MLTYPLKKQLGAYREMLMPPPLPSILKTVVDLQKSRACLKNALPRQLCFTKKSRVLLALKIALQAIDSEMIYLFSVSTLE